MRSTTGSPTRGEKRDYREIAEMGNTTAGSRSPSMSHRNGMDRPSKSSRLTPTTTTTKMLSYADDDPVVLARKALEMFNKEVESDNEEPPSGGPEAVGINLEPPLGQQSKETVTSPITRTKNSDLLESLSNRGSSTSIKPTSKPIDKRLSTAWQKASRSCTFSDDPSIL